MKMARLENGRLMTHKKQDPNAHNMKHFKILKKYSIQIGLYLDTDSKSD